MASQTIKRFFFSLCLAGAVALILPGPALTAVSSEAKQYMKMLDSDTAKNRVDAAKRISRTNLTDKALYDKIEKKILAGYDKNTRNKNYMDEMAWMCKALAASGNKSYLPTLEKVATTTPNKNLKRHAQNSIKLLSQRAKEQELMKDAAGINNNLSPEENKAIAMVRSGDPSLMKNGAKTSIHNSFSGSEVTDAIKEELLKALDSPSASSRNMVDAMAWMCKALGASGNSKYRDTLTTVLDKTRDRNLKRHAQNSLNLLQ